ncbi:unnamed protein product [Danaus chrysippus]|uniref:(African queen) hypothetical protein n=1 Tax=Danaus chrysippus TaxID=151541 RepID=A0A8J2QMW7_9NEOP|nr:unnamed protein product [Danaus chrysippus]
MATLKDVRNPTASWRGKPISGGVSRHEIRRKYHGGAGEQLNVRKYKYGRPVTIDIAENIKTLYNLIICCGTEKQQIDEVDFKKEDNNVNKLKALDFKYEYYFETDVDKFFDRPCPFIAPGLGPVAEDRSFKSLTLMEDVHLRIQPGGIHTPIECIAIQKVAIVIPIDETIPRGELYNIGFKEAQAYRNEGWDCVIFHESHLIPLDTRNLYRCSHRPRMLIADFQKPIKKVI